MPFWQSESVPVCSTVLELNPSMPTQKEEYWFDDGQDPTIAGTVQDPLASVTEPAGPVTAYPLQLVLVKFARWVWDVARSCGNGASDIIVNMLRVTSAVVVMVDVWNLACKFCLSMPLLV